MIRFVERLDAEFGNKLWSSVRHRQLGLLTASVPDVGCVFISDVDVNCYLRVRKPLHFLQAVMNEMRTIIEETPTQNQSQNNNISELLRANSGEVHDCHFYTEAHWCSLSYRTEKRRTKCPFLHHYISRNTTSFSFFFQPLGSQRVLTNLGINSTNHYVKLLLCAEVQKGKKTSSTGGIALARDS